MLICGTFILILLEMVVYRCSVSLFGNCSLWGALGGSISSGTPFGSFGFPFGPVETLACSLGTPIWIRTASMDSRAPMCTPWGSRADPLGFNLDPLGCHLSQVFEDVSVTRCIKARLNRVHSKAGLYAYVAS